MGACTVLGVVPVRLGSTRLPGKALLPAGELPLFAHVARALVQASRVDRVVVATDAPEVMEACADLGLEAMMTATTHRTGSERCAQVAAGIECQAVINAQGDWPEIEPRDLDRLVSGLLEGEWGMATLTRPLQDREMAESPHVVKAVADARGRALYFSRSSIPFGKGDAPVDRLRHVGVYAFRREVLLGVEDLPPCPAAVAEGLEQLSFLYAGVDIQLVAAEGDPWGIETRADYDAFLQRLDREGRHG